MNDTFGSFISGVVVGALVMFSILAILAYTRSTQYEFVNINGLSCLEVDSQIVSCNWEEWRNE